MKMAVITIMTIIVGTTKLKTGKATVATTVLTTKVTTIPTERY